MLLACTSFFPTFTFEQFIHTEKLPVFSVIKTMSVSPAVLLLEHSGNILSTVTQSRVLIVSFLTVLQFVL